MSGSHLNPTHDPYISIKQQQDTLNVAIQQNADHPEIQAILRKQKDDLGKYANELDDAEILEKDGGNLAGSQAVHAGNKASQPN